MRLQHSCIVACMFVLVAPAAEGGQMDMGSMRRGHAPPDARDPNAYADGFTYTNMPGFEESDRIKFATARADEFEGLSGNQGQGFAWSVQANYGDDHNKAWFRTQGLKDSGPWDPTTDAEILWWRPWSAFWGMQLGLRQDFGAGSHTYVAAGIEGLAPYWLELEATAYVGEDGRLAARLKGSYDILFTNRLILTTSLETNLYSRPENDRGLGSGLGNIEAGLRARYELTRKVAPYVGYVLERSFLGTADRRRAAGDPVTEHRFVAGIRMWR
jgi:copper resistance protein B